LQLFPIYDIASDMKIVLDTSVMDAALRSPTGASAELLRMARHKKFDVLISVGMILEYEAVMKRAEHLAVAGLTIADIDAVLDAFCIFSRPVINHFRWRPVLTDTDDDLVLETAANGMADAIVTFNVFDFQRATTMFGINVERPGDALRRMI
jgi:putative PIN family toxin of toxin-antitoxin system